MSILMIVPGRRMRWGMLSEKPLARSTWRRRKRRYARRLTMKVRIPVQIRATSSSMLHNTSCSALLTNTSPP
ncbi:MAG: hypothetical protein ACJ8OJ_07375 [Povalibacter sp.]